MVFKRAEGTRSWRRLDGQSQLPKLIANVSLGLVSYSLHGRLQSGRVSNLTLPERRSLSTSP